MSPQDAPSLFDAAAEDGGVVDPTRPLADRLRPRALTEVVGQDHLLAPDAPLGRMVASGRLSSVVLWGPPGCGKTTIARLLADRTGLVFEQVSATFSGVTDLRRVFAAAARRRQIGRGTLLFVDEIHRFNRAQQDSFLPYVEDGTVVLVGATTENPSFELNGALLSRCQVLVLRRLDETALAELLERVEALTGRELPLTGDARAALVAMADGDGRYLLGMVEQVLGWARAGAADGGPRLDAEGLTAVVASRAPLYDKSGEEHYNLISALHKSMRGSDPDAALYWLARMLVGGEDPRYVARRLVRFASEDVGMADPSALQTALAAWEAYERLGSPEGELAIAQAVVHLATALKSVALYRGLGRAREAARRDCSSRTRRLRRASFSPSRASRAAREAASARVWASSRDSGGPTVSAPSRRARAATSCSRAQVTCSSARRATSWARSASARAACAADWARASS